MLTTATGWRLACVGCWLAMLACEPARAAPRIGHVFILVLENEGYRHTFGRASPATYLNHLRSQGALASNYFATSHFSLGNYIALISGQAPNPATEYDCPQFTEFVSTGFTADGQAIGSGCVYPAERADDCRAATGRSPELEGVHGGHGKYSRARERRLRAPSDRHG